MINQTYLVNEILKILHNGQVNRTKHEINMLLKFFSNTCDILKKMDNRILLDVINNCSHLHVEPNTVLLEQGKYGQ
ncbi:hypothetical protein A3Q56_07745, partial [Intoshia linei]